MVTHSLLRHLPHILPQLPLPRLRLLLPQLKLALQDPRRLSDIQSWSASAFIFGCPQPGREPWEGQRGPRNGLAGRPRRRDGDLSFVEILGMLGLGKFQDAACEVGTFRSMRRGARGEDGSDDC